MNKKFGNEPAKLKAAVPAPTSLTAWWRRFSILERDADAIRDAHSQLCVIRYNLHRSGHELPDVAQVELSEHIKTILPRARAALAQIDSDDHYDKDEDSEDSRRVLKKRIIGERLAMMLGAMSLGAPKNDPEVFARMLLEHVHDAEPTYLGLESACRQIEAKQKFSATISEVLEAIDDCEMKWENRCWAISHVEALSKELGAEIATVRPKFNLGRAKTTVQQAERKYYALRSYAVQQQSAARAASHAVEAAMAELADSLQAVNAAKARLAEAEAAIAAPRPNLLLPKAESSA
jgi:hypothetical protein